MLLSNKRFGFWRVFWVVLACYIFFLLLGILATVSAARKPIEWSYFFSKRHLISQCTYMVLSVGFFYFTLSYYYHFFVTRKSFFYYLRHSLIVSFIYGALVYVIFKWLISSAAQRNSEPLSMFVFFLILYTCVHIGISLLIAYLTYLRDEKKRQKVLEEQKMQLEVEKSSANLNFLKAQINPHFLHNTLNFLYAKSLPYSPELSEGILTLSDIMRYALSEGNAKDGKAPLKDEIEHVWNVIKINQLRFSNKLNVDFQVTGLTNGVTIIPFVLITIVENAFKHGDLKSQENPIVIRLDVGNNNLRFSCRNKKKTGPKELSTGVGLDNIRKRLDLAYGNNYRFDIRDEQDFYSTELTIDKL
ncbi:MAG TPA: histidine kinase [Chitinophagaceae bacterium]|nr:histidine kinase [Chitinophagaceae bacterium]